MEAPNILEDKEAKIRAEIQTSKTMLSDLLALARHHIPEV